MLGFFIKFLAITSASSSLTLAFDFLISLVIPSLSPLAINFWISLSYSAVKLGKGTEPLHFVPKNPDSSDSILSNFYK